MKFISIEESLKKKSGKVAIRGWIYRIRKMKDKIFIVMRDSSEILQCVVNKPALVKIADGLLNESSLEIEGSLNKDKRAPNGEKNYFSSDDHLVIEPRDGKEHSVTIEPF